MVPQLETSCKIFVDDSAQTLTSCIQQKLVNYQLYTSSLQVGTFGR